MTSVLMLSDTGDLLLHDLDFPEDYVNKQHKNDYKIYDNPIKEYLYVKKSHHNRLLLRISYKIENNNYVPISFICDTGAPSGIYLSKYAKNIIKSRIHEDELQNEYIILNDNKKINVSDTPLQHGDINIFGIQILDYLCLKLSNGNFILERLGDYL